MILSKLFVCYNNNNNSNNNRSGREAIASSVFVVFVFVSAVVDVYGPIRSGSCGTGQVFISHTNCSRTVSVAGKAVEEKWEFE